MATLSENEDRLEENQLDVDAKEDVKDPTAQQPQDVLCDSCMDGPSNAVKSCLTCLVSYCEAHLRPHLENAKFQNHRLVDPLHNIDCQTCDIHQLPLRRYCLTDCSCVCPDCEGEEHHTHATESLEDARKQIEIELQQKHKEISETVSATEKYQEKLQNNNELIKSKVQEVCVAVEGQFLRLQATVEEARRGVVEELDAEQKQAFKQAAGMQAHLEQRRAELMKTVSQMNKLSRIKSDVDFLQEHSEWRKAVTDVSVPGVHIARMDHLTSYVQAVTDATEELCNLIVTSYRQKLSTICKEGTKSQMRKSLPVSLPDPETLEDFLKYKRSLTFDPDTTHHFLRLMEDNSKLTNTSPWQHSYPDHPDRFAHWRQAVTSDSLYSGRHFIEAELSGEGAHIGVTYKSIDRKGEESAGCITGNDFSWCVGRNSRGFSAWHAAVEAVLEATDLTRIGLYLDFDGGCVSFYNVTDSMRLLHKYSTDFTEPLYVAVWLSKKDNVVSLVNTR
ncbi:tripartite motif-containing protein 16-like protein [Salarias fasciatus]|uniref:Tripartite motif-containing protein 16-like protein n=1 Tax=Salarias fasciatus TaxID=181472 RepID=A0A672F4C3_SALFA|nr:tripartite motif-containing protein 16-like protein [Salarias fasciatus]